MIRVGRAAWGRAGRRPLNVDGGDRVTQVHPRLLVGEDDAAILTDRFVGACLLGMPVRVDQRVDATGCQSRFLTAASRASALVARPPSIISAPSLPGIAITLHPAPWSNVTPPRSVVEIRGAACRPAPAKATADKRAAGPAASAPLTAAAPTCRNRRRENRGKGVQLSPSWACRSAHEPATHREARCPPRRPGVGPGPATRGFAPSVWSRPARGEAPPPPCSTGVCNAMNGMKPRDCV